MKSHSPISCFEQFPALSYAVLTTLLRARAKWSTYLGMWGEMQPPLLLMYFPKRKAICRQHHLNDFDCVAKTSEGGGLTRGVAATRLDFAPTLRNTPTLLPFGLGAGLC